MISFHVALEFSQLDTSVFSQHGNSTFFPEHMLAPGQVFSTAKNQDARPLCRVYFIFPMLFCLYSYRRGALEQPDREDYYSLGTVCMVLLSPVITFLRVLLGFFFCTGTKCWGTQNST